MTTMLLIAFLGITGGGFLFFGVSPLDFAANIAKVFGSNKKSLARQIKEAESKKKIKGFRRTILETKEVLTLTGKENMFSALCVLSVFLFIIGVLFAVSLNNPLMLPITGVGLALVPFWYVLFTANFYKKQLNNELETALSIITTSYLRSENFILAVQENMPYLNPPVSEVFRSFLAQTNLINGNIRLALENIKYKIASGVYREWIDAVIACQDDKTLKTTLTPIISKLSDMRIVSAELDYLLYEPVKEFITMAILLAGNIPLIYFLNKDWFHTLFNTAVGKGVLAVSALAVFVSLAAVIKLSRPIEYKR